ncbi:class I SAM-dependent methyltransferase [Candidatus Woesebacteria bacterium]|nr:MAG: class I SAM-dependent methyltransferase [Candidatus Woesebacteria bacterium]
MTIEINGKEYNTYQARRGQKYIDSLFLESRTKNKPLDNAIRQVLQQQVESIHGPIEFYAHDSADVSEPRIVTLKNVNRSTGGFRSFFADGARVLDIGSGAGLAVSEFSMAFPKTDFIGVDNGYTSELVPAYPDYGKFVCADWNNLPFAPNTFTGFLSAESFPKHAVPIEKHAATFQQITRIAQPGAVWRGTNQDNLQISFGHKNTNYRREFLDNMHQNGWDVFLTNHIFIAKLTGKQ